jgi:hypothetical protein
MEAQITLGTGLHNPAKPTCSQFGKSTNIFAYHTRPTYFRIRVRLNLTLGDYSRAATRE